MVEFPDMKGFSLRNIKYIRQWFLFYSIQNSIGQQAVAQIVQQVVAQIAGIPWEHNIVEFIYFCGMRFNPPGYQ